MVIVTVIYIYSCRQYFFGLYLCVKLFAFLMGSGKLSNKEGSINNKIFPCWFCEKGA